MFHVELRQFPHNVCRFNLSEAELLAALVRPWARAEPIDFGERRWSPHTARLTVLEGPELSVQQLAMGRGWRNAQRASKDVTERVLARAREPIDAGSPEGGGADEAEGALLTVLGEDPQALLAAWRLAAERRPELSPSASLALAEATLRSLDANRPGDEAS
jgi:hypothetical protein